MKVTPAHDPKDFECGRRHELPEIEVIDKYGKLCGNIDQRFVGMDRFDARQRVVEELQKMNLYVDKVRCCTSVVIYVDSLLSILATAGPPDCAIDLLALRGCHRAAAHAAVVR